MSHFAVAVILKDIKDLKKALAPYQENNMGNCPKEYLEFYSSREELLQEYERYTRTMYRGEYGNLYRSDEARFKKEIASSEKNNYRNWGFDGDKYYTYDYTGYTKIEIPYKQIYATAEEYLQDYCKDEWNEEAQDYGRWENPNRKWDYWTLCAEGEWARYKNAKMPLGYCKLKEYDKSLNEVEYKKALRFWELVVEDQPLKKGEEKPFNFYKKEYYTSRYGTKEEYAKIEATPHYWAFVLDGKWYEKGEMGWFGLSSDTKETEAVYLEKWQEVINNPQYKDYYIAVVDCHI